MTSDQNTNQEMNDAQLQITGHTPAGFIPALSPDAGKSDYSRTMENGDYGLEVIEGRISKPEKGWTKGHWTMSLKCQVFEPENYVGFHVYLNFPVEGFNYMNKNGEIKNTSSVVLRSLRAFFPDYEIGQPIKMETILRKRVSCYLEFWTRQDGTQTRYPNIKFLRPYIPAGFAGTADDAIDLMRATNPDSADLPF